MKAKRSGTRGIGALPLYTARNTQVGESDKAHEATSRESQGATSPLSALRKGNGGTRTETKALPDESRGCGWKGVMHGLMRVCMRVAMPPRPPRNRRPPPPHPTARATLRTAKIHSRRAPHFVSSKQKEKNFANAKIRFAFACRRQNAPRF